MPTTINTPRDTTIQATNTALGLLGKDASLQDIKTALLQIVAALTPSIDNDYEELINKPSINSVSLVGNKTNKQLGIRQIIPMTSAEYAQLTSAEKLDDDIDYLITDSNAVSVPIDDDNVSVNKVWSSDKVDSTKVDKENVLNTVEECSASTDLEDVAGASAVSTLNSSISAISYNGYGTKVEVTLGSYYTVPSNGLLVCSSNANSVGTAWCFEGNFGFVVSGSSANSNSSCIPVFSGQRWSFTMSSGSGSAMFVPYSV